MDIKVGDRVWYGNRQGTVTAILNRDVPYPLVVEFAGGLEENLRESEVEVIS